MRSITSLFVGLLLIASLEAQSVRSDASLDTYLSDSAAPTSVQLLEAGPCPSGTAGRAHICVDSGELVVRHETGTLNSLELGNAVDVTSATHAASFAGRWIYVDNTSNNVEIDAPVCDADSDGQVLHVRDVVDGANNTTFDPAGSELINGSSTTFSFDAEGIDGFSVRCKGTGTNVGWWSY